MPEDVNHVDAVAAAAKPEVPVQKYTNPVQVLKVINPDKVYDKDNTEDADMIYARNMFQSHLKEYREQLKEFKEKYPNEWEEHKAKKAQDKVVKASKKRKRASTEEKSGSSTTASGYVVPVHAADIEIFKGQAVEFCKLLSDFSVAFEEKRRRFNNVATVPSSSCA